MATIKICDFCRKIPSFTEIQYKVISVSFPKYIKYANCADVKKDFEMCDNCYDLMIKYVQIETEKIIGNKA